MAQASVPPASPAEVPGKPLVSESVLTGSPYQGTQSGHTLLSLFPILHPLIMWVSIPLSSPAIGKGREKGDWVGKFQSSQGSGGHGCASSYVSNLCPNI